MLESKYNNSEIIDYIRNSGKNSEIPRELRYLEGKFDKFYQYRIISFEVESSSFNKIDCSEKCSDAVPNSADLNFSLQLASACRQVCSDMGIQLYLNSYNIKFDHAIIIITENQSMGQLWDIRLMDEFMTNMVNRVTDINNISVYSGVSSVSNDLKKISDYYLEAQSFIKYKLFYAANSYLISDIFNPVLLDKNEAERVSDYILNSLKNGYIQSSSQSYTKVILNVINNVEYTQSLEYVTNLITDAYNLSHNLSKESKERF